MLGLGRALGETMAVTFVIGNTNRIATVAVRTRQHHRLDRRAGVPGKPGRQPEAVLAAGAWLHPVRHLVHRAGDLAAAAAPAAEGMSMSATMQPAPSRDRANDRRSRARWAAGGTASTCWSRLLCIAATVIGLLFLASILLTLLWRGVAGLSLDGVHHHDPAARLAWRLAQCDRRHADPDRARHADRHADRPDGRHLSRRIRPRTRRWPTRCASCPTCCCRRRRS